MTMGDLPDHDTRTVEATETSVRIIRTIKRLEGAGVTELATELELTKSTVYKHLSTLRKVGFITKDGTTYRLAVGFLGLGIAARSCLEISEPAKQSLETLSETTGEVSNLIIPENGCGIYAHRIVPTNIEEPPIHEGERVPLHATAGGKAILAYTPSRERERIFEYHGHDTSTEMTSTDRDELDRELQNIRDTRTSYDQGTYFDGWYCIAAPITDADRQAVGAVTVIGPENRIQQKISEDNISNHIGSTANSIQNRFRSL